MKEIIDQIIKHYDDATVLFLNSIGNKKIEDIDRTKINAYTSGLLYSISVISKNSNEEIKDYIKTKMQDLLNKYEEIK